VAGGAQTERQHVLAPRLQGERPVEVRDPIHLDQRHGQPVGDPPHGLFGNPAFGFLHVLKHLDQFVGLAVAVLEDGFQVLSCHGCLLSVAGRWHPPSAGDSPARAMGPGGRCLVDSGRSLIEVLIL
jgi:hypothetical protein